MVHSTVTVTTSSAEVLAENTSRSVLMLQNISDTDICIKFGEAAVADSNGTDVSGGIQGYLAKVIT